MSKHTPGPWTLVTAENSPPCIIARGKHDICVMAGAGSNEGVMADARLIAAAPELLEALKRLCGTPEDPNIGWRGTDGTDRLFACEFCGAFHEDCALIEHKPDCHVVHAFAAIAKVTKEQS